MLNSFSGYLVVDKPPNVSSHDVVLSVRKIVGKRVKVGHTGTLDPLATGVLILAVGKATRLSEYLLKQDKCYIVKGRFGLSSDTYDLDGKIEEVPCPGITKDALLKVLERFRGEIEQIPPPFSAIRIKGKRAYELARKGEKVELKPRRVKIYSLKLLDFTYPDFELEVCCSSGTYIRTLVHDIGKAPGCDAVVVELRRTKVANVTIDKAVPLSELSKDNIRSFLIPADELLDMPEIKLSPESKKRFKNGAKIRVEAPDGLYKVYSDGEFLGVGVVRSNLLKPEKVLS
ncbi:MAG: tRNA pseudouridine(55) synthase TruB [Desulfurobacterium sp.]|nr:MAG: tRNA pseudouridine(55) synthase TruB [Desulfurobacterium sp.]